MNEPNFEDVFKSFFSDWCFLSEQLAFGTPSELGKWAARWEIDKARGAEFLSHNGVLKTFAWFLVDALHPEIVGGERSNAKADIFDLLDTAVTLKEDRRIFRESKSVDWASLKLAIAARATRKTSEGL